MKNLTNPKHFTFTNHFNKSMLHNRIVMMNKIHFNWKTVGKYLLFMMTIAGVIAAVKPNKNQINNGTKYLLKTENELEWVITPKTGMADLVKIQEEFQKHGLQFDVHEFKLDPLQAFIRSLEIHSSKGYLTMGSTPYTISPVGSYFGKINFKTKKGFDDFSSTQYTFSPALLKIAEEDSIAAHKAYTANAMQYEIEKLEEEYAGGLGDRILYLSVPSFPKPMPYFYTMHLSQSAVLKDNVSPQKILEAAAQLRKNNAVFRVNSWPCRYDHIEKLNPKDIKEFFTINVYDRRNKFAQKTFVFIRTS